METFIKKTLSAIRFYPRSFELLSQYRLWGYVFLTSIVAFLLAAIFISLGAGVFAFSKKWISSIYPFQTLREVAIYILSGTSFLLTMALGYFLFKGLMLAILSPLLSHISMKVEEKWRGQPINKKFSFWGGISRGIVISLYMLIKEMALVLLLMLLGWIPLVGQLAAVAMYLVSAYYYGYGMLDLMMERHFSFQESKQFVQKNKPIALGVGLGFVLILLIPIFGLVFGPILSTITATVLGLEELEHYTIIEKRLEDKI